MNAIEVFDFPTTGQSVRTPLVNGEPWFVARDVCDVLGIGQTGDALRTLEDDERGMATIHTPGGPQQMAIVSEAGLYSLILRSRKSEAKAFKRWVTHEVLPAIRKTGSYTAKPLTEIEMARQYVAALEREQELAAHVAVLKPSADAWDKLASSGQDFSCRDAAYILNRDPGIKTGPRLLFGKLREWRLIDRFDRPYADHKNHVVLKPRSFTDRDTLEEREAQPQVRITYAGLKYLHKRLGGVVSLTHHLNAHQMEIDLQGRSTALVR